MGEVEDGKLLDEAIDKHFSSSAAAPQYKPLIHEITSGVIRWKLYLDWVLSRFAKEAVKRDVRHLLWVSLYQVFFMRKAAYHVVNEAVEYAKEKHGRRTANFVNAILRRSIRERDNLSLPTDPLSRLSTEYSFPRWLVGRWFARFDEVAVRDLLALLNRTPDFAIRIDLRNTTREAVAEALADGGIATRPAKFLRSALYVDKVGPLLDHELFKKGIIHIQDETSQMAAIALAPANQSLILDACAGQGTKTDQIREMVPSARLVAMDLNGAKLRSVRSTKCLIRGDVLKNPLRKEVFDSILLDAPCTSLGIIRKHPEIKWRRKENDVAEYGCLQVRMIRALSENLKSGGRLVYSVCSFEPEETVGVVEQLTKEGSFEPEDPLPELFDAPCFLSLPHVTGGDGFFVAKLKKL